MEKTIISQLQPMLQNIIALSKQKKLISFDYDKEADVLYISFEIPQQVTDTQIVDDNILLRKRGDELVGITVMHASKFH